MPYQLCRWAPPAPGACRPARTSGEPRQAPAAKHYSSHPRERVPEGHHDVPQKQVTAERDQSAATFVAGSREALIDVASAKARPGQIQAARTALAEALTNANEPSLVVRRAEAPLQRLPRIRRSARDSAHSGPALALKRQNARKHHAKRGVLLGVGIALDVSMRARSRKPSGEPLGLRHRANHGERREERHRGTNRRKRNRRSAVLRVALATATMALSHHARPEMSKRSRRDPVPAVTTSVESAILLPLQHAYDDLIREAADRYDVDAALIKSVIHAESAFNAWAVSRAGARGLMQLRPEVADELGVDDPFDARENVMAGAQHLRRLLDRYHGNVPLALAGYNAGVAMVRRHGGVPPFPETQKYIKRVTALVERSRREEKL